MNTYQDYLQTEQSLNFEEMNRIYSLMIASIGSDQEAKEIYEELLEQAIKYTSFRAHWDLWSVKEKLDKDPSRTSCHDSLLVKFNMLARYLSMNHRDTTWRAELGDEKADPYARKRIGDFACFLVFVHSINAR